MNFHEIHSSFDEFSSVNTKKKNVQIMFMLPKLFQIKTLEPLIEDHETKDMNVILEKKLKKSKRQAVRNLKKEGKLINFEKQKERLKKEKNRQEEIKASNRFIEQSTIEYKKLMSSQPKKRVKEKRKKRMAGGKMEKME